MHSTRQSIDDAAKSCVQTRQSIDDAKCFNDTYVVLLKRNIPQHVNYTVTYLLNHMGLRTPVEPNCI